MNNVINMVNYYVEHKNADDSVVEYIKNKLESSDLTELIIISLEPFQIITKMYKQCRYRYVCLFIIS